MADLTYDVVACEFPVVYTIDGDHDPSGLLFVLRAYQPLLDFARARWEDDDQFLPRTHERAQWTQLVVDGLRRYELMRAKLEPGDPLLDYGVTAPVETGLESENERSSPLSAREQNLRATVDELLAALDLLTDGAVRTLPPDAATRAAWVVLYSDALSAARAAIAERLAKLEVDDETTLRALARDTGLSPARVRRLILNDHRTDVTGLGADTPAYDRFNPLRPLPLARPLVLRASLGQSVEVRFENQIRDRQVGLHVQGDVLNDIQIDDGAEVGRNISSLVPFQGRHTYHWTATHEGAYVINDLGDVRGDERGTNSHGLFGAFLVEPAGATWRDPETGENLTGTAFADGAYVDIIVPDDRPDVPFVDFHSGTAHSHREFTVFMHDEPSVHSGLHVAGEHDVMPLSLRAEPMPNRLPHRMRRLVEQSADRPLPPPGQIDQHAMTMVIDDDLTEVFLVARNSDGEFLERVAGEEQHHSSWLFGDPVTPIFRAYKGDPARVRVLHAGVKETHVYHLHVHQWRQIAADPDSQLVDSITIGPQTGITLDPLYGSGSRQKAPGDVIWHCHLYPHFHHGMWGLWRSFDRLVDGSVPAYPDGTPVHPLEPLPGRAPLPRTPELPGFPWFMDAAFPQKSPPPPAVIPSLAVGRRRLLGMPPHSELEAGAFPPGVVADPRPGAVFVDLDGDAAEWNAAAGQPAPRVISYDVVVDADPVVYNSRGWTDPRGHHYQIRRVTVDGVGFDPPADRIEPFFPRANHGDIVEWRMFNNLDSAPADGFDLPVPPAECGLHVHLVKFDVLVADGSSTGFNYLSGASCLSAVDTVASGPDELPVNVGLHRWVVDEEFGPCFFHDHLLANYRQKHGLFAALIAEPFGSRWLLPDQETLAWSGPQAVVLPPLSSGLPAYREAGIAVGDFVPLVDASGAPLNPPGELGGDDDPGVMAVNYRCSPLTFRGDDPSQWFASTSPEKGDPETEIIRTYPGDRLRIRLIQGSHEEQHSFVTHGLRWPREWKNDRSALVNQQTIGISEAFTLDLDAYGLGDHLWHFAAMDDLWLGCWGLVRSQLPSPSALLELPPLPGRPGLDPAPLPPRPARPDRDYVVSARRREIFYDGRTLTDPWGLIFSPADGFVEERDDDDRLRRVAYGVSRTQEPLVLRARPGEWIRVTLINDLADATDPLLPPFGVEPVVVPLPLDDERTLSSRVSLHPSLLRYDVVSDDGAFVGRNHDSTVPALDLLAGDEHGHASAGHDDRQNWREYWWFADPRLEGQVCYLQDMADVRNHRHHGLVGALVVEPTGVTPVSSETGREQWTGAQVVLVGSSGERVANEQVLLVQDGLRHFVAGNPTMAVPDVEPGDDPEDAGQKGINYGTALAHPRDVLSCDTPPTPIWPARVGDRLWLRLLGAADKPRNHSFTVHGMSWPAAPWVPDGPVEAALSGLTTGYARTLEMRAGSAGDHAYRSCAFRWAVEGGVWGIIRVAPRP
ncbi:multicopper oxidase domain-containing protein [Actinoplanes sp. NPDC089786]|uniref:multicopper oxidase domain-containing protein n=1 Tax=Actinoplanes sp. NPDC089786 TaxID=3155185 RepID=UPI0034339D35